MTRDDAIHLAKEALKKTAIKNVEYFRAAHEQQHDRNIWLVVFALREEEGKITSPDTIFVEVDEDTQKAAIVMNP